MLLGELILEGFHSYLALALQCMSEIKHTPCIYDIRKNGIKYINTQNKSAGAGGKYVLNQDSRVGSFVQNKNHFNVIIPV